MRKRIPEAGKRIRDPPIPTLGVPETLQDKQPKHVCRGPRADPLGGSMIAASFSVSPYVPCLVDSLCHVLLVSFTHSGSYSFLPFFLRVPQALPNVWTLL